MVIGEGSHFEAIFFAPASTQRAYTKLCKFIALDRTHTRSKYCMMLLIAYGIDANNNVLPLAWALVPTENEAYQTWFCEELQTSFPGIQEIGYVFISDREKGLAAALSTIFPFGCHAYCCQHIADNVQSNYRIRAKALFWPCAQAKTCAAYEAVLAELLKLSLSTGEYVDSIPYKMWAL